jgi:guanidinopropionase
MRLPYIELDNPMAKDLDIGLIGIPWDGGTTNKPGARLGPRAARDASTSTRNTNRASGINPFALCNCADMGDSPVNPLDIIQCLDDIARFYSQINDVGITPLSIGGDHLVSLPILRALAKDRGPLGMVHFDAHSDMWDSYFGGSKFSHGTGFRRAIEEGLLDPKRVVQIGLRGALYQDAPDTWGEEQGVTVIDMDLFRTMGVPAVIDKICQVVQGGEPTSTSAVTGNGVYISFDIDVLDPAFVPGTGTPEIGGLTSYEGQQLIRGLRKLKVPIVGGDVVELAPMFDQTCNSSLVTVTMMYEILCVMAENMNTLKSKKKH